MKLISAFCLVLYQAWCRTQENLKKHIIQLSKNNTQEVIQKLLREKEEENTDVGWTPGTIDVILEHRIWIDRGEEKEFTMNQRRMA